MTGSQDPMDIVRSSDIEVAENVEISTELGECSMVLATPRSENKRKNRIEQLKRKLQNSPSASNRLRILRQIQNIKDGVEDVTDLYHEEMNIITSQERENENGNRHKSDKEIFKDVVFFVDIRKGEDNRTEGVKEVLRKKGLSVTNNIEEATHVLFKEGLLTTYNAAIARNLPLLALTWIESCRFHKALLDVNDFKATDLKRYENQEFSKIKRKRSMQPDGSFFQIKPTKTRRRRRAKVKISKPNIRVAVSPNCTSRTPVRVDISIKSRAAVGDGTRIFDEDFMETSRHFEFPKGQHVTQRRRRREIPNDTSRMVETPIRSKLPPADSLNPVEEILNRTIELHPSNYSSNTSLSAPANPHRVEVAQVHRGIDVQSLPGDSLLRRSLEKKNQSFSTNSEAIEEEEEEETEKEAEIREEDEEITKMSSLVEENLNLEPAPTPVVATPKKLIPKRRRLFNPNISQEDSILEKSQKVIPPPPPPPEVKDSPKVNLIPKKRVKAQISGVKRILQIAPKAKTQIQELSQQKTQKNIGSVRRVFAFTCCTNEARELIQTTINELKCCRVDLKMSENTTHLIMQKPYEKTEKLLLAICRGLWVLGMNYVEESRKCGFWLPEERYEIRDFVPAICTNRATRAVVGRHFTSPLLQDKTACVSEKTKGKKVIESLVVALCGTLVNMDEAEFVISDTKMVGLTKEQVCVTSNWVIDSICAGCLKHNADYGFR